jgi:hypothetical protein
MPAPPVYTRMYRNITGPRALCNARPKHPAVRRERLKRSQQFCASIRIGPRIERVGGVVLLGSGAVVGDLFGEHALQRIVSHRPIVPQGTRGTSVHDLNDR